MRTLLAAAALLLAATPTVAQSAMAGEGGAEGQSVILVFNGPGGVGTMPATTENVGWLVDHGFQVVESGSTTVASGVANNNGGKADTYTTTWTDASGMTHTVVTPPKPLESVSNHAWRHAAAVNALLNNPLPGTASHGPAAAFAAASESGTMVTSWQSQGPGGTVLSHSVSTPTKAGETPEEQAERHQRSVYALAAIFKPLPQQKTSMLRLVVERRRAA